MDRNGGEITQEEFIVQPICCCGIDEDKQKVIGDVDIPGVEKKDIEIHAFEDGFRLKAARQGMIYSGVYHVGCKINPANIEATYRNGILHLEMPIAEMPNETRITVG